MNEWTVWGSGREPILEGTEEECRKYILSDLDAADEDGMYLTDPHGKDWEYDTYTSTWKRT